jgi:hypothetical protein
MVWIYGEWGKINKRDWAMSREERSQAVKKGKHKNPLFMGWHAAQPNPHPKCCGYTHLWWDLPHQA